MGARGTAIIDFGEAPGSNVTTTTVSDAAITVSTNAEAWIMADSTASHNSTEHILAPIKLVCEAGSGSFIIHAFSDVRLTGTFQVHYVWL